MKAVIFQRCGDPGEVLEIADRPPLPLARGEVRVRMLASPINPSDLLYIRGEYGQKPRLPAVPGFEGVGVVTESGGGLLGWRVLGKRVAVLNGITGNWQAETVIPARQALPVPDGLSDEQAAMYFVNPASSVVMVRYVLKVPRGAWLLQTAAGSALGRMVIRLGKLEGFRTINVVRRRDQVEELRQLGADQVICTADEPLVGRVQEITAGQGVRYAIDAVAGETATQAVDCLARRGHLLLYGVLSGQPIVVPLRGLLVGSKILEGFWLADWVRDAGVLKLLGLMRRLNKLLQSGVLTSTVGQTFALEQVCAAARAAAEPARAGKILLRIADR